MSYIFKKLPKNPLFTDFAPNETFKSTLKGIFYFMFLSHKKLEKLCKTHLKKYLGQENIEIIFFFSGRNALFNLYKALSLKEKDEAIYQAFTCSTAILPALALKIKPCYVDIESLTFSANPIDIKQKLNEKTKALILQHTYGFTPINRLKILLTIKKYNILLIEDIAHTIKPIHFDYDNNKQFFLLSFGRSKALSSVFGGAVVLKNKKVGERLKNLQNRLKNPGILLQLQILLYKLFTPAIKSTYTWGLGKILLKILKLFFPPEISEEEKKGKFNEKIDLKISKLQLAFLLSQLESYKKKLEKRKKNLRLLLENISHRFLPSNKIKNNKDTLIRLPIFVKKPEKTIEKLKKKNIFLSRWYYKPIIGAEDLKKLNYQQGSCKNAEKICKKIITIGLDF